MNCYYCNRRLTQCGGMAKTKDHIIPMSKGGVNGKVNIVLCCKDCNQIKGSNLLYQFMIKIEKAIRKEKKYINYTSDELQIIVRNVKSLIDNCLNVFGKQLFVSKHDYESYMESSNYYISKRNQPTP